MKFIFSNAASLLIISGGMFVELDQRYVKSLLDAMAMDHCKSMATPGSKGQESSRNVADLTETLDPQEHREFRSGAGIC